MVRTDYQCDPRFRPLLRDYDERALAAGKGTVYGVWADFTLAFLNPAWFRFAGENQGEPKISRDWTLGRSILEAIPPPILPFFQSHYGRCLAEGRPWEHHYECSSPDVYRKFHLNVFPLGEGEGLLLVNSLVAESHWIASENPLPADRYQNRDGILIQCCHCRRFRQNDVSATWDWVGDWVRQPPEHVSHGLCESCLGFYYGELRLGGPYPSVISTLED